MNDRFKTIFITPVHNAIKCMGYQYTKFIKLIQYIINTSNYATIQGKCKHRDEKRLSFSA